MAENDRLSLRVLRLARTEAKVLLIATVFLALSSVANLAYPQAVRRVVDEALAAKDMSKINWIALAMLAVFTVQGLASSVRYYLFTLAGERIVLRLRERLYSHMLDQDIAFYDFNKTGELMSRLSSDCTVLQNTVSVNISMGLRNLAGAIGGLVLMFYTSPTLSLVMVAVIPPFALGAGIFGRRIRAMSRRSQDRLADASIIAEETLSGIRTVRAFAQENFERSRYSNSLAASLSASISRIRQIAIFMAGISVLGYSAISAVLWLGGRQVIDGRFTSGDLLQFLLYLVIVAFSVGSLGGLWGDLMAAAGAAKRVFEILDRHPHVQNGEGEILPRVRGEIEFKDVSFHYPTRPDIKVLSGLNFQLLQGKKVALVGSSGSGKSTIASLMTRHYEPSTGSIYLDGIELSRLKPDWLRAQMGVVSQEPILISSSIKENIRYGRLTATDAEISRAAELANAREFVEKFPEKYETLVGERGIQLSGGQKQRVAIARAILKDPKILVLDEATSALDTESEHLVQEALNRLMEGRTTLVIAHRLATVRNADIILVMENGGIVESGTHQELIGKPAGAYRKLVERQFT